MALDQYLKVALRKESVDRNTGTLDPQKYDRVALRKESVDRNFSNGVLLASGSSVALRKESVDRNRLQRSIDTISQPSLSARRAWIEIKCPCLPGYIQRVALRKESVDRNF